MSTCPNCKKEEGQVYEAGFPGNSEEPPEPAGMYCTICGWVYPCDRKAEEDVAYEKWKYSR